MSSTANQIRDQFLRFFQDRQHTFVKSAPVVPQDDPTLLFTNAGMNQFKAIFLGENRLGLRRAVNSQKCMRVSGKHNDLEEVGRDHHHHTFFEMLGNWSFGDYYKKEAISWAWELLTEVWQLPKDRLFVTVHDSDDEAAQIWQSETDIEPHRIMKFGDKDNFWEMGDTGPCGPCSEIHFDTADDLSDQQSTYSDPIKGVNGENDRYREIWNLVFIQYNREKDGSLNDLPSKHVDTGMGFERIVSVLQGTRSNYDTDVFRPIITEVERLSGKTYTVDPAGTPFRVIADHIRALTFAITDGAFPSNEGRGYVLRRLLRRAYRFGRELGFTGPFLYKLVPVVGTMMGDAFPEIRERQDFVSQTIRSEEERFAQTLDQGIERFAQIVERCRETGSTTVAGADVFSLYDTYGFPMDLTRLMAEEQNLTVDEAGFEKRMEEQRTRAREAQRKGDEGGLSAEGWVELKPAEGTKFVGYEQEEAQSSVVRYKVTDGTKDRLTEGLLVLDITPFYAESGGQVGDTGELTSASGSSITVEDTFTWNEMVEHKVRAPQGVAVADFAQPLQAQITASARNHTRRNHSVTHLLQAALRQVLGDHVNQSGSRVAPDGLRFDFTHMKAMTAEEIARVEDLVNEWVLADLPITTELKSPDEAKKEGATALFGEKYGDTVRVVTMGSVSKELCGGTHAKSTGTIGLFHITGESSIAAGIRRVEAITGMGSLACLRGKEQTIAELTGMLKVKENALSQRITDLLGQVKTLETEVAALSQQQAGKAVDTLFEAARKGPGPFPWVVKNMGGMEKKQFSSLTDSISDTIREQGLEEIVVVLAADVGGKALFAASAGKKAVEQHGVHCGEIVKMAAQMAGGGGGGSPVRAQAGAKDVTKLQAALDAVAAQFEKKAGQA